MEADLGMLRPVVALVAWSFVMWVWMYATRLPALSRAVPDTAGIVGGTGEDLRKIIPARAQWPADNYNHLMEQPTLFYAVAITLAVVSPPHPINHSLAWGYVALRVVHSIFQATVNRVVVRFGMFVLASLCLAALTLHAAMAVF